MDASLSFNHSLHGTRSTGTIGEDDGVVDFSRNYPRLAVVAFAADNALNIALKPFSWAFFGVYKVTTMAGSAAGGILGGACGTMSAIKEAAFGENGSSWASAKKSIHDYAIRGASCGYLTTVLPAAAAGLWAGLVVTALALPVLLVAVPVVATLGALSALEYVIRGESYIQTGLRKVTQWLSPSTYFKPVYDEFKETLRGLKVKSYSSLEFKELPVGVNADCPILLGTPETPIIVENPAGMDDYGHRHEVSYTLYDFDAFKDALLKCPEYILPHNRQRVDWSNIYRTSIPSARAMA